MPTEESGCTRPTSAVIDQGFVTGGLTASSVTPTVCTVSPSISVLPALKRMYCDTGRHSSQPVDRSMVHSQETLGTSVSSVHSSGVRTDPSSVDAPHCNILSIATQMQISLPISVVSKEKAPLKRLCVGGVPMSGPVTKVIITRNPLLPHSQVVPVKVADVSSSVAQSVYVPDAWNVANHGQVMTKGCTSSTHVALSSCKTVQAGAAGSPNKHHILSNRPKQSVSLISTPSKLTVVPVCLCVSSSQRLAVPSGFDFAVLPRTPISCASQIPVCLNMVNKQLCEQRLSPSKVFIKQTPTNALKPQAQVIPVGQGQVTLHLPFPVVGSSVQPVQVPGSRFHYVRLVSPSHAAGISSGAKVVSAVRPIAPAIVHTVYSNKGKVTLAVNQSMHLGSNCGLVMNAIQTAQRTILPATCTCLSTPGHYQPDISANGTVSSTPIPFIHPPLKASQLLPGATILAPTSNLHQIQGFALVPAQYLPQLLNSTSHGICSATDRSLLPSTDLAPKQGHQLDYVSIASNNPTVTGYAIQRSVSGNGFVEAAGARPRKPCNCTKSQCLKLYCDCFANGEFCYNCNCNNCANNLEHEEERSRAIKSCLDRNPMAFHPKIGKSRDNEGSRQHNKGCNCKRSGCLKNYCECYEAKIMCSAFCKCVGCKNFEESSERKTLMHLADAAEVRVQQQAAAKSKLSSQISSIPSRLPLSANGERLPFTLITADVAEATAVCLLAQAEEAERLKMPPVVQERMVIEEFGRCLIQIIDSANRTKGLADD